MAEIASAFVTLMPSARGFGSKLDSQISPEINKSGKKGGLSFGKLFAAGAALGIGAKAFSFLGDSLAEAKDAQVIGARTENVIAKMGNAANISAGQVGKLAESISKKTGIDDEAIQSGQNLLLTFGNIKNEAGKGNDIFSQTSKLMVDMSAAMGTDAKGSAIQLGKALNDPVKGITALSRVGVSFTEQQKKQIAGFVESGDTMKAQKVILGELERQFGGAAKSMATPGEKAAVAFGNLKEQIGTALLPVVESLSRTFTNDIAPAISTFVTEMQSGEGAGGRFRAKLEEVGSVLKKTGAFIKDNATTIGVLVTGLGAAYAAFQTFMFIKTVTMAVRAFNLMLIANPIGLVVAAIAALVVGLVIAYKKSDTFKAIVDAAFRAVAKGGKWMWENVLKPAFEGMKKGFEAVGKAGVWLWNNALQPAFKFIVGGVANILDMWSKMLAALGKVPGFEWAKKASDAMATAATKAREMADGINKIPTTKRVDVTVAYTYTGLRNGGGSTRGRDDDFLGGTSGRTGEFANAGKEFLKFIKTFSATSAGLMETISKGIKGGGKKAVAAALAAFEKLNGQLVSSRDTLKGTLQSLRDEFDSLATSVKDSLTGDLFSITATEAVAATGDATAIAGKTVGQNFVDNLLAKKGQLTGLLSSFQTLKGWGLDPAFLSQLFASGNGALITELAGMGQSGAVNAASLFGEVNALGKQLGNTVASNDPVAAEIVKTNELLTTVTKQLNYLGSDIGKELNSAAAKAKRRDKGKKG